MNMCYLLDELDNTSLCWVRYYSEWNRVGGPTSRRGRVSSRTTSRGRVASRSTRRRRVSGTTRWGWVTRSTAGRRRVALGAGEREGRRGWKVGRERREGRRERWIGRTWKGKHHAAKIVTVIASLQELLDSASSTQTQQLAATGWRRDKREPYALSDLLVGTARPWKPATIPHRSSWRGAVARVSGIRHCREQEAE